MTIIEHQNDIMLKESKFQPRFLYRENLSSMNTKEIYILEKQKMKALISQNFDT